MSNRRLPTTMTAAMNGSTKSQPYRSLSLIVASRQRKKAITVTMRRLIIWSPPASSINKKVE